jgi:hypothetical protein
MFSLQMKWRRKNYLIPTDGIEDIPYERFVDDRYSQSSI